jgi:hypothetical protein
MPSYKNFLPKEHIVCWSRWYSLSKTAWRQILPPVFSEPEKAEHAVSHFLKNGGVLSLHKQTGELHVGIKWLWFFTGGFFGFRGSSEQQKPKGIYCRAGD